MLAGDFLLSPDVVWWLMKFFLDSLSFSSFMLSALNPMGLKSQEGRGHRDSKRGAQTKEIPSETGQRHRKERGEGSRAEVASGATGRV